jgi:hypothetical protein
MVLLRAACVCGLLALTSCWSPVFNQDISVAELVRGKMKLEKDFTQTLNNGSNNGDLLQAGVSYDGTAYIILSSNHNQVSVQWSSDYTSVNNSTSLDLPLADPSQVSLQPDSSDVTWFIPTLTHQTGAAGDARDIFDASTTNPFSSVWETDVNNILGFCTIQYSGGNQSAFYLTETTSGTATLNEMDKPYGGSYTVASTPPFSAIAYTGKSGWMAVDTGASSGTVAYLTHPADSSGEYTTDMLNTAGLMASWKGHDYVAGFLSTRRLLTREGSYYNVCDTSGKVLYSFPAGTLRYAGEYYDTASGTMRLRLAEAMLQAAQNGGQDKVRVRIYSIATSKLDSLQ